MSEGSKIVGYKLDALTRSVRFFAGIAPKVAVRVGLGISLAIGDSAADPAGELFGLKLKEGANALASSIGSIASSVRNDVRSKAVHLSAADSPISKVPALKSAREFVTQATDEIRGARSATSNLPVRAEEPQEVVASVSVVASEPGHSVV